MEKGWHAGSVNAVSIGIEICEYEGINFDKAVRNAQELVVHLMGELNIPSDNVEPHKKEPTPVYGIGSLLFTLYIKAFCERSCLATIYPDPPFIPCPGQVAAPTIKRFGTSVW